MDDKKWLARKKFLCNVCQRTFSSSNGLRLHERIHQVSSDNEADSGSIEDNTSSDVSSTPTTELDSKVFCSACQREFSSHKSLILHQRIHLISTENDADRIDNPEPMISNVLTRPNDDNPFPPTSRSHSLRSSSSRVEVFTKPHIPREKQQCRHCKKLFVNLENHKKCLARTCSSTTINENMSELELTESVSASIVSANEEYSEFSTRSHSLQSSSSRVEVSTKPHIPREKQQCQHCKKLFVNLANHKKCIPRTCSSSTINEQMSELELTESVSASIDSANEVDTECSSDEITTSKNKNRRRRIVKQKQIGRRQKCHSAPRTSFPVKSDTNDTSISQVQSTEVQLSDVEGEPQNGISSDLPFVKRTTRPASNATISDIPTAGGATAENGVRGKTRKNRLAFDFQKKLKKLKEQYHIPDPATIPEEPMITKLRSYHDKLLKTIDNIVTQKVSAEAADVIADLDQIDDPSRPLAWSDDDRQRLDELNKTSSQMETPKYWPWAAPDESDQGRYNTERMKLFQTELKTIIRQCPRCLTASLLIGPKQMDSTVCYDCIKLNKVRIAGAKEKLDAWASVRPKSMEYPKRVEPGHTHEDLPELSTGEKAVIAPVMPVVTVTKNFKSDKKLRQESITLTQDPDPTWTKILPRTNLENRFVVIERTSKDDKKRHIVARPENVRTWLMYLFKNHPEFVRLQSTGQLRNSSEALASLTSSVTGTAVELAEVHVDVDDESDNTNELTDHPVVVQPAMESGFSKTDVFTLDKHPELYVKSKDFLKLKASGRMELVEDHFVPRPTYNTSANMAFPHLYPNGEKSPLDFGSSTMSRYLLKKQTQFAHRMSDGKLRWFYADDSVHMCHQYSRMVEQTVHARVGLYLTQHPDAAHVPIDSVLTAFKNGFNEEGLLDSQFPGLSTVMAQLPNSRERWYSERMGIESISRDLGDPTLFVTLNMEPRAWPDVRELVYMLEHGREMPRDEPFELNTERYSKLMEKFAPQISLYLCKKTKLFMRAYFGDICNIPDQEPSGDWMQRDRTDNGWYWGRVEFTQTRGCQHWHYLIKMPRVLDTAILGRIIQSGRLVRNELKANNIKPDKKEEAFEIVEMGLLASRYSVLFADSISTTSFYSENVSKHDPDKVVKLEEKRREFVNSYKAGDVTRKTHPIMRRFGDAECDQNLNIEMAAVASVSCIHDCIPNICGGSNKVSDERSRSSCRFNFPQKLLNATVPAVMQVNVDQMEARILLRRTCRRIPNLSKIFLLHWRANHDVTVLVDAAHKMRYATKYAAKSGQYTELLDEIIEYLSKKSIDELPTNLRQTLSHLILADCSHRAFLTKQELSYKVMDLPPVIRSFADVSVVGFYRRANITLMTEDNKTIVYSDRTEYAAYAERCKQSTVIEDKSSANDIDKLTSHRLARMNYREFCETISHSWIEYPNNQRAAIDPATKFKFKTRDVESGYWMLKPRQKRRHIRCSTVLYTPPAYQFQSFDANDDASQTSFFGMSSDRRKHLYRSYMELVCYVPWIDTPEESFLSEEQRAELLNDTEKDSRYSRKRLTMFFDAYMKVRENGHQMTTTISVPDDTVGEEEAMDTTETVDVPFAPPGSQWQRDNQYSNSMWLTSRHNRDVHLDRVGNNGVLKAQYESSEELDNTGVDIRPSISDEVDNAEYPSALNFLQADTFREVIQQTPPSVDEIQVAFPECVDWKSLQEAATTDTSKLFKANPPPPSVPLSDLTPMQRWAVKLAVDGKHPVLYFSGKAGCGKTEVALHICNQLKGRVQVGAGTGKAASNFNGPTVHAMFSWAFDGCKSGDKKSVQMSQAKLMKLRIFYDSIDVFIFDEANAMSAAVLAKLHDTMTLLFNPEGKRNAQGELLPFGGRRVIFLGDPAQLKPVAGEPIYGGSTPANYHINNTKVVGPKRARHSLTASCRGQELYRKYLQPNSVVFNKGKRNFGLLQHICDKLRDGMQTEDDLNKLAFSQQKFPDAVADFGIHYSNEQCSAYNWQQLWSECKSSTPPKRLFVCKASYHTTETNQPVVDALSVLPPTKFSFAPDVLCVSEGCDVRLVKNINVAAGLVNSATGRVMKIIYNNADVSQLIAGKHVPPYCLLIEIPGFVGFLGKNGQRLFPFPDNHYLVPFYREKFQAASSDIPSWILKRQNTGECYREQFPVDLSRHMTVHRAQGQTMSNCVVSVNLNMRDPGHLPPDMSSLVYVACTRVTHIHNLRFSVMSRESWMKLGHAASDDERRWVDKQLKAAAEKFAVNSGMYDEYIEEMQWKADVSECENEWLQLQAAQDTQNPLPRLTRTDELQYSTDHKFIATNGRKQFPMCTRAVASERHIGLDQGRHNFGIAVVDRFVDESPKIAALDRYNLNLPARFNAPDVFDALVKLTPLWQFMQQTADMPLPQVDRVVVHVEVMSPKNPKWRTFGVELAELLQQSASSTATSCFVKLSKAHLHRAGGPVFHMGKRIVAELSLTPVSYGRKRRINSNVHSSLPKRRNTADAERDATCSTQQVDSADVEPDDNAHSTVELDYSRRKDMSARICRYVIDADDERQCDMRLVVDSFLQTMWKERLELKRDEKLDDIGDALLHALNDLLCGSTVYKELVPRQVAIHRNRTIVVSVQPATTYFAILHCTWNRFLLENYGSFPSRITTQYYNQPETLLDIKTNILDSIPHALMSVSGNDTYGEVERIKVVVKQLKGHDTFTNPQAGCLTQSTVSAVKEICDEAAGTDSKLNSKTDKILGSLYIRTNREGHSFQVIRSAGKITNAVLSCPEWMNRFASRLVESRTMTMTIDEQIKFFNALEDVASSPDTSRLGMLELSESVKQRLAAQSGTVTYEDKNQIAHMILVGINQNQQHLSAIAANYRKPPSRLARTDVSKNHDMPLAESAISGGE